MMPDRTPGARDGAIPASSRPMKRLVSYFLRGLLITLPAVFTGWLCYEAFRRVDSWLGIDIPGVGFLVTLVLITLLGFLGSNLVTRGMVAAVESLIERLPFVRLVYTSTKDLLDAFVGQKKRFNKPVAVHLSDDGAIRVLGFVTQDSLAQLGLEGTIMVYVPFSYSLAGWTCLAPASRVKSLDTSSADFMAFVVSGGVVDVPKLG
ncbi:MAG: DUF502 domain-containing protein [Gemmatimonadaceae bacterium]|nr:DUF502 domain-containing protein [Gemmatimonadaceae bacterium]